MDFFLSSPQFDTVVTVYNSLSHCWKHPISCLPCFVLSIYDVHGQDIWCHYCLAIVATIHHWKPSARPQQLSAKDNKSFDFAAFYSTFAVRWSCLMLMSLPLFVAAAVFRHCRRDCISRQQPTATVRSLCFRASFPWYDLYLVGRIISLRPIRHSYIRKQSNPCLGWKGMWHIWWMTLPCSWRHGCI